MKTASKTLLDELIEERGLKRYVVAGAAEIPPTPFSLITQGRLTPTPEQRERIAHVLEVSIAKLWPDD